MIGFLGKRIGLSLLTLWLLSVIVFVGAQILPGNVGRAMLGGLSSGPFPGPPWSASGYTSHARMALVGRSLGWPSEPREGPAPGAARAPTQLSFVCE